MHVCCALLDLVSGINSTRIEIEICANDALYISEFINIMLNAEYVFTKKVN